MKYEKVLKSDGPKTCNIEYFYETSESAHFSKITDILKVNIPGHHSVGWWQNVSCATK